MKATFAFLANIEVHNFVRKLMWDIHRRYGIGLDVARLPPHISLKQPFTVQDLDILERYMDELAGGTQPLEVSLSQLQLVKTILDDAETGILWLDVQETEGLRQSHLKLNRELAARFKNTQAPFDGADYHFHMTVAIGGRPWSVYQSVYDDMAATQVNLRYIARELALFVYDDRASVNAGYITYKILPLANERR